MPSRRDKPIVAFAALERLPARPAGHLDPVLDAVERCLTRYGLRRATMTDIARDLGVARTTLYRQVSSIEDGIALVASRHVHALLDDLVAMLADEPRAETFVDAAVRTVRFVRSNPLALRLLNEEPELIGGAFTSGRFADLIDQVVELVAPVFESAMRTGALPAGDPRLTASLVVRLIGVLALAPAGDDLEALMRLGLQPLFQPAVDASV